MSSRSEHNHSMDERDEHSTVCKNFGIDQRAMKVFLASLPDHWLPRKQDPDFFIDYLVEIVENGEPTGKHFGVQIKGYEDTPSAPKALTYRFKTKHLYYYLNRSQHPIFLLLVNVTTREGYWIFAQKFLKEMALQKIFDQQESLTIHFEIEDSLYNLTKFKCLLPEAERFVRDLHPGSIHAALEKRKAELEKMDPRCSVSISVENGKEQITVTPNESFPFTTKIQHQTEEEWKKLFERGEKLKLKQGDLEFTGAPIMQEALKNIGGEFEIQYGKDTPASIHIISKTEPGKVIPIEGRLRTGTKFFNFQGQLPNSPLSISFEVSWESALKAECFNLSIGFSPKNWTGQPILSLAYFDQITAFASAFSGPQNPGMEIFIQGNSALKGVLGCEGTELTRGINQVLEWFRKCRLLAKHFEVNPHFPSLDKFREKKMDALARLYALLTEQGIAVPSPNIRLTFYTDKLVTKDIIASSDRILRVEKAEQTFDFFGMPVRLGPIRHVFTEMDFTSQKQLVDGSVEVVLSGTGNTTRTSSLL